MTERITRKDVESRLEMFKHLAIARGVTVASYGGATVASMYLYQAYGTSWIMAETQGGGSVDIGHGRGMREVYAQLSAMIEALEMIRYTQLAATK